MKPKIIVIAGPTAVGKTEYAIKAAQAFNGEIISADSMQLYKYMDIGSAKPTPEELSQARHYLVDEIDPGQDFSVSEYQRMAKDCIRQVLEKGMLPIISGGTGLYINSLIYDMDFSSTPQDPARRAELRGLLAENGPEYLHRMLMETDPQAAARIHPNNSKKIIRAIEAAEAGNPIPDFKESFSKTGDYDYLLIGLDRQRQELYDRINLRVDLMAEAGLENEVRGLLNRGLTSDSISMKGIGYKEMIDYILGSASYEDTLDLIKQSSRRYAKRQLTWLRRYDDLHWINLSDSKEGSFDIMKKMISDFLSSGN